MEGLVIAGLWIVLCLLIAGAVAFAFIRLRRAKPPPSGAAAPPAVAEGTGQKIEGEPGALSFLAEVRAELKKKAPDPPAFDVNPSKKPSTGRVEETKRDRFLLAGTVLEVVRPAPPLDKAIEMCHANPRCTHFEFHTHSGNDACVFKDARAQPPECMLALLKWADGLRDGVVFYHHPERVSNVAIRHVHDQLKTKEDKMNESKCDGWCIGKWILSALELVLMVVPVIGPSVVFALEAGLMAVDLVVDEIKEQNEKRQDDMLNNPSAEPKTNLLPDVMWLYMMHDAKVPGGITGAFTTNDVLNCKVAVGTYEYEKVFKSIERIRGSTTAADPSYNFIVERWERMPAAEFNYADTQWAYFKHGIDTAKKNDSYKEGLFGMVITEAITAFTPKPTEPRDIIEKEWFSYLEAAHLGTKDARDACAYTDDSKTTRKDAKTCLRKACEPVYAIINGMAKRPPIEYS